MNDELRNILKSVDPMPSDVPTESVTSPEGRHRLESIMSTETTERTTKPSRTRAPWYAAAAAAVVAVVAVGAIAISSGDSATDEGPVAGPPLELSGGESNVMASCIMVTPEILADVEVAFAGTVTDIDGEIVTLTVTDWFTGGDADSVVITAPSGLEALLGSVPFAVDGDFLVSATNGVVNYCGLSGEATSEMQALYSAAFPG